MLPDSSGTLEGQHQFMAFLLESSPVGIIFVNREGRIRFANTRAEQILGLTIDEMTQRAYNAPEWKICDYDGNPFPNDALPFCRVRREQQSVYHIRHAIQRPDGGLVLLSINASPVFDASGHWDGMVATIEDVTEQMALEKERWNNQEKYRTLFDTIVETSPAIIYVYDMMTQHNVYSNAGIERVLGYTPEEIRAMGADLFPSLLHPEDLEKVMDAQTQLLAAGDDDIIELVYRMRHRDGQWRILQSYDRPFRRQADGSVSQKIGLAIDITERKQTEKNLQDALEDSRLRQKEISALLEASQLIPQSVTFQDAAQKIFNICKELIGAQSGYVALLSEDGHENEVLFLDAGGLPCDVDPELPMPIRGLREIAYRTKTAAYDNHFVNSEWMAYMPSGHVRLENVLFATLNINERAVGLIGIANKPGGFSTRDANIAQAFGELAAVALTYASFQEELRANEAHLEDMVKDRTAKLEESRKAALNVMQDADEQRRKAENAQRAAETANQAKSQFLTTMSHEFRTPMNVILGFAQLMQRDAALTGTQREHLNTIMRSGEHLLQLINDVLDMSRIEAGQVHLSPSSFDLRQMILSLEEMLQVRAHLKGLRLTVFCGPTVPRYIHTDERKLRQILINLLGNAIKFTEHGEVTLRVICRQPAAGSRQQETTLDVDADTVNRQLPGAYLAFEISDTGIGIDPKDLELIFSIFGRTHKSEGQVEGSGLGLTISQQYVHLLGGELHVVSETGKGSVFSFEIRTDPADLDEIPPPARRVVRLETGQPVYRILVVEDHPENRLLLTQLLQGLGFEVDEAANGQEALELYQRGSPDLIWLDIQMPVMDGYETAKRIREYETRHAVGRHTRVPIIALTANVFEKPHENILAAGCDDLVYKPFQEQDILNILNTYLRVRYEYEEKDKEHDNAPIAQNDLVMTPEMLAVFGHDVLNELEDAIIQGNVEDVDRIITSLRTSHRETADIIAFFAQRFRYDELLEWIQQAREGGEHGQA